MKKKCKIGDKVPKFKIPFKYIFWARRKRKFWTFYISETIFLTFFDDFCKKNVVILATEILSLRENNLLDKYYISSKIKKTYKNRYFHKNTLFS